MDGDGDRLILVDNFGRLVDGDQILYLIACDRQEQGTLTGPVVGTVMSNLGLELALRDKGIDFRRAKVGDRYVLAMLAETGGTIGGESSGHILCLDRTTTGDALVSALQVLSILARKGRSLAELTTGMPRFPQVLLGVKVAKRFDPFTVPGIVAAVRDVEARLGDQGRVVLRASGTEPLIRVMVEGVDEDETRACAEQIVWAVKQAGETHGSELRG